MSVDEARSEIVERLMPHVEERGLVVCIVCGGDGLGGASVVHRTSCPLAQMMAEWGWEPIVLDEPPYSVTCIHKLCTAESTVSPPGQNCGHAAMMAG